MRPGCARDGRRVFEPQSESHEIHQALPCNCGRSGVFVRLPSRPWMSRQPSALERMMQKNSVESKDTVTCASVFLFLGTWDPSWLGNAYGAKGGLRRGELGALRSWCEVLQDMRMFVLWSQRRSALTRKGALNLRLESVPRRAILSPVADTERQGTPSQECTPPNPTSRARTQSQYRQHGVTPELRRPHKQRILGGECLRSSLTPP